MSLFDTYFGGVGGGADGSALERRIAELIGSGSSIQGQTQFNSGRRPMQSKDAIGFAAEGAPASSDFGPRDYVSPGLPPQTQLQVGQTSAFGAARSHVGSWTQLVGIIFCLPSTKLGREEVVPHLEYLHHRSGSTIHFFCPGYVKIPGEPVLGAFQPLFLVGGSAWRFDVAEYNRLRSDLGKQTTWQYSGETDLLLLAVQGSPSGIRLDFRTTIACNVEQMLRDQAIPSFRSFVESLIQFAEQGTVVGTPWQLSDYLGIKFGALRLVDGILGLLPEFARSLYKGGQHLAVRDVSKAGEGF